LNEPVPSNTTLSSSSPSCCAVPPILIYSSYSSSNAAICILLKGLFAPLTYCELEAIKSFCIVSIGFVEDSSLPVALAEGAPFLNLFFRDFRRSSRLDAKRSAEGDLPVNFSYLEDIDSMRSGEISGDFL